MVVAREAAEMNAADLFSLQLPTWSPISEFGHDIPARLTNREVPYAFEAALNLDIPDCDPRFPMRGPQRSS